MSEAASVTTRYVPFIESDPTASAQALRERVEEQGYLYFRALVPADVVLSVRHDVLTILSKAGWLDPTRDLMEGIAAPGMAPKTEGQPEYTAVYRQILHWPAFHEFPAHPTLMGVADKLLEGEVLVHPRRIGRITFPGSARWTTPAHQDYYYIRGSVDTYSCWTPLGDCPIELGGLAIWPGSHKQGYLDHSVEHPGAIGGCGVPVDESQVIWHTGDFGLGDALFFRSYTIHKALPNLTQNRLRLSTDNRYQVKNAAIDPSALKEHFADA